MSILRLILQTSIAGHHSSKGQTLDREDGFQLLAVSVQEMMSLSLEEFTTWRQIHLLKQERGVHDVVTDTSAETRKVEGKLDALVNLVTQLAVNQKSASVARLLVRQEISDETDRITRKTKAISNVPIQLSIYSPHALTCGALMMFYSKHRIFY
ncbi:hypothetical protein Fmac_024882 [Flemingia macrophylla]|uniref:Uncharacterized protein n=1 Tax=Flemingia macrophylla TaxID=520843 RepID=A0ABD1LQM6_9FABA